jgi:UDP-N-acetylmuramate dehydrogenase
MAELSLPCFFESNVPLNARAYYAIGGTTRFLARPENLTALSRLLFWNREHRLPLAIMGSGSNIIFSDELFPGIVISLDRMQKMCWLSDDELFCEAGVENTLIAEELLKNGKSGGEWLHRLPGQIGSTVRMNARCFGGEVSAVTSGILTATIDGRLLWQLPGEVFHGYKHTSLMERPEIVVAVVLRFQQVNTAGEIGRQMQEFESERTRKHHFDFPSCGSTFKNNYDAGRSSGRIFEELGFKGETEGGAMVSEHHANFIYNRSGATAVDVLRLAARMKAAALDRVGVELDLEVQCIGLFDRELLAMCGVRYVPDEHNPAKGWAGLLWHSDETEDGAVSRHFPRTLMNGPLVGYSGLDREFPSGVYVAIEQLLSLQCAAADPEAPFLRWTTRGSDSALFALKPPASVMAGGFTDELWQFGVTELFIGAGASGTPYLEFEMTPGGEWVALHFEQPRKRAEGYTELSAEPWRKKVCMVIEEGRFGMEFSYELLRPFITAGALSLQCAASSGSGVYGLFPWWHTGTSPADFHQPDQFYRITLS